LRRSKRQRSSETNKKSTGYANARGGASYRRAVLCTALLALSCAGSGGERARFEPAAEAACRSLDSVFALSGWREPMESTGRVKLDVKQYRVQGRFRARFVGDGDFTFEFTGTMALGGHHEDVVVSFQRGTLYVLDRERGRLYEGDETDQLIREGLGMAWKMGDLVRWITAWPPACNRLSGVAVASRGDGGATARGRVDGHSFQAEFTRDRLEEASWPLMDGDRSDDRLSLRYWWRSDAGGRAVLDELVAYVEGRRWRMVLEVD
jgi:hypothetical protein